jgi:type I restriction enzyme M protein
MFFTVTLPATLWFFDKAKQDNKLLFIDARNIFTQIDRAHREFNEAQIQNIAIISKLHKGNHSAFVRLVDSYFAKGIELLLENQQQVIPVGEQLLDVLDDEQGKAVVKDLVKQWQALDKLQQSHQAYKQEIKGKLNNAKEVATINNVQHKLRKTFDPFFESLHAGLKQLDKIVRQHEKDKAEVANADAVANGKKGNRTTTDRETKKLKETLELLHKEVKIAETYYKHIHWLQERFPKAEYEDVIGLCKLASQEEVKEQDYSLNPGRYVGVVIEEDGKTEEEFIADIVNMSNELKRLDAEYNTLKSVIQENLLALVGDE